MIILITGGTGMVGRVLTDKLKAGGHTVRWLSRSEQQEKGVETYRWDLDKGYIDPKALKNVDAVVHLAGAGIADERWTDERKRILIDSRVKPMTLLQKNLEKEPRKPGVIVSASAIGFYGGDTGEAVQTENSPAGKDFLAECTVAWEKAVVQTANAWQSRCVLMRLGVVLSNEGGAFQRLTAPIRYYAGTGLGSGQQWLSWVHIEDVAEAFVAAITQTHWQAAYNIVAPEPARHQEVIRSAARAMSRPLILPNAPAFTLRLALGEMAVVVLGSSRVASERLDDTGFSFQFTDLDKATHDLVG